MLPLSSMQNKYILGKKYIYYMPTEGF